MLLEPRDVAYILWSDRVKELEGQLLTLLDASFTDSQQRKAVKDLARPMIWQWVGSLPQAESKALDSPEFTVVN